MKYAILLAAALLTTSPAQAKNYYIPKSDGEITLMQQRCPTGDRSATFIESRGNGGAAYGCWTIDATRGEIVITWTQFIGPTGSILNVKRVWREPIPAGGVVLE